MKINFVLLMGFCVFQSAVSMYFMSINKYNKWFKVCNENLQSEDLSVIGPKSVEYFIYLLEKIENAAPTTPMENILELLLKRFVAENFEYNSNTESYELDKIYDSSQNILSELLQIETDNFSEKWLSEKEKCSMFYMLSYNINTTEKVESSSVVRTTQLDKNKNWENGHEQGVVSLHSNGNHSIALGRVLTGIYAGLSEKSMNLSKPCKTKIDKSVSPLYAFTLSDILTISGYVNSDPEKIIGPGGHWLSTRCTSDYELDVPTSSASYAYLKGAIDGFILGSVISQLISEDKDLKLSQLLRMYYSPQGIYSQNKMSYCTRENSIYSHTIVENLESEITVFLEAYDDCRGQIKGKTELNDIPGTVVKQFQDNIHSIIKLDEDEMKICNNEDYDAETPKDVYIILDTKNADEDAKGKQFYIAAELASKLNLGEKGLITIVFDTKKQESDDDKEVKSILKVLNGINQYCLACTLENYTLSTIPSEDLTQSDVIDQVNSMISKKANDQKSKTIVPSKVAIFFNYDKVVGQKDDNLKKALIDLRENVADLNILAVGTNKDRLKLYTSEDYIITDDDVDSITTKLIHKLEEVPSNLQYADCDSKKKNLPSQPSEIVINRETKQYIAMHPKYFYSSKNAIFTFSPNNGDIRVCHNEKEFDKKPEQHSYNCKIATKDQNVVIPHKKPCKGKLKGCDPFVFSIIGLNRTEICDDDRCQTPDSVKFTIMHEGLTCGASGLMCLNILLAVTSVFLLFRNYETKC